MQKFNRKKIAEEIHLRQIKNLEKRIHNLISKRIFFIFLLHIKCHDKKLWNCIYLKKELNNIINFNQH